MATQNQSEIFKPQNGKDTSIENGKRTGESNRSSARFARAEETTNAQAREAAMMLQLGQNTVNLSAGRVNDNME